MDYEKNSRWGKTIETCASRNSVCKKMYEELNKKSLWIQHWNAWRNSAEGFKHFQTSDHNFFVHWKRWKISQGWPGLRTTHSLCSQTMYETKPQEFHSVKLEPGAQYMHKLVLLWGRWKIRSLTLRCLKSHFLSGHSRRTDPGGKLLNRISLPVS